MYMNYDHLGVFVFKDKQIFFITSRKILKTSIDDNCKGSVSYAAWTDK